MTENERKHLILDCRIYDGSNEPNFPGWYEECWVDFHEGDNSYLDSMTKNYIQAGLKDFSSNDGTPISLKALLFNRYMHWVGIYSHEDGYKGFKNWYIEQYRNVGLTNRQKRFEERKKELIKKCRFYRGENESPYEGSKQEHFWKYERIWVEKLAESFTIAKTLREDLHRHPMIEKFVYEYKLPSSLIGLFVNRDEHWLGVVNEVDFIKGLKEDYLL